MIDEVLIYLGVKFVLARTLNADFFSVMRKFHAAANAIFSHREYVSEFTKLHLLVIYHTNANIWSLCNFLLTESVVET